MNEFLVLLLKTMHSLSQFKVWEWRVEEDINLTKWMNVYIVLHITYPKNISFFFLFLFLLVRGISKRIK